jgi:hypothetical protein
MACAWHTSAEQEKDVRVLFGVSFSSFLQKQKQKLQISLKFTQMRNQRERTLNFVWKRSERFVFPENLKMLFFKLLCVKERGFVLQFAGTGAER